MGLELHCHGNQQECVSQYDGLGLGLGRVILRLGWG